MADSFGWHSVGVTKFHDIRDKLANFETMTWSKILRGSQNHAILRVDLCQDAQKRLRALKLDDIDSLISLRLSGTERIFGILERGVLRVLWWDPEHRICPSPKRHT